MNLNLNHVKKSFGTKHILDDITFDVAGGEFVSLIGPSGSGKSTLFNIIGGILAPDAGDVLMNGTSIINQNGHISYMPQEDSLFPWRTILNNVLLPQELQGETHPERAIDMLTKAGLKDVIDAYPHELSGGMKQRAAFIRALLCSENLMCLDEPFSALDEFTRLDMQKWLLETWEEHEQSILFITHNIEEALFLSDKIIILTHPPAKIREIVTIPFERPRNESLLLSDDFLKLKKKLMALIQTK